jgi:hypothetical protein
VKAIPPSLLEREEWLAALPWPEQAAKKVQQGEEGNGKGTEDIVEMRELEEEKEEKDWQKKLRRTIMQMAGLTAE